MPREVLVVGCPAAGPVVGSDAQFGFEAREWIQQSVNVINMALSRKYGSEVYARYLEPSDPELDAYAAVKERLGGEPVRFPLLVVDGRVIQEGGLSVGVVLVYLAEGQIPSIPEGHSVTTALPPEGAGKKPEGSGWKCVGRWWRRLLRSSSS